MLALAAKGFVIGIFGFCPDGPDWNALHPTHLK